MSRFILLVLAAGLASVRGFAYDVEDYEAPGGMSFSVQGSPQDSVYGICFEDATWLVNTPVIGQFFLNTLRHDRIDSTFGGVGMILRIMPHWRFAPYAGGGASYNYLFGSDEEDQNKLPEEERIESTWAGHAEGGVRVSLPGSIHFFEVYARQTWSAVEAVGNYWTLGFGYGQNW